MTLGARTAGGRPVIGVGVACRVRSTDELRVLVPRDANRPLLKAVAAGSALAATFSRARDHRSIQIKTSVASIQDVESDDPNEAARQSALLADDLMELGYTRLQAESYAFCGAVGLVALAFRPERVFTQTPGPGAGAELRR